MARSQNAIEAIGVGGAALAATGPWMNSMALMVAVTTLMAAGEALFQAGPTPAPLPATRDCPGSVSPMRQIQPPSQLPY